MRAKFLSHFDWQGKDVYSYLDLDTKDIVWLLGGRNGEELRRFPYVDRKPETGRAIDIPPKVDVFDYVIRNYLKDTVDNHHIHW
jgi:hypothetical protein